MHGAKSDKLPKTYRRTIRLELSEDVHLFILLGVKRRVQLDFQEVLKNMLILLDRSCFSSYNMVMDNTLL